MSSTRHAAPGNPMRQERFASSEEYRTALNGGLVAKRCSVLRHDPELAELLWYVQWRSLADVHAISGCNGSVEALAAELLSEGGWEAPRCRKIWVEDLVTGQDGYVLEQVAPTETRHAMIAELAAALRRLALDPCPVPTSLPGVGERWRAVLARNREVQRERARQALAPTSIAKLSGTALGFARQIRKLVLVTGRSDLGKSAAAKAFCAASGGTARYVLTPPRGDMDSLFREVACALGVADSHSRKASEVCSLVETMLSTSRLMLVFDEAHNLFSGLRRVTRQPERVMWVRRLYDLRVPIALVALPEFRVRMQRCAEQLEWDDGQIRKLICDETVLPDALTRPDFEVMAERLGDGIPDAAKRLLAASASNQRGAQYVVDTIAVARNFAEASGRTSPSIDDVRQAIGIRPQFNGGRESNRGAKAPVQSPPRPSARLAPPVDALPVQHPRMAAAEPLQPAGMG